MAFRRQDLMYWIGFFQKQTKTVRCDIEKREIVVRGELTIESALAFLAVIIALESDQSFVPVKLLIDSCAGGYWVPIKHMYGAIHALRAPLLVTAKNYVRSGAVLLFAAASHRSAYRGTELFFHPCFVPFDKELSRVYHEPTDVDFAVLRDITRLHNQELYTFLSENFGLEATSWMVRKWCEERRTWILDGEEAKEALELQIVHQILEY